MTASESSAAYLPAEYDALADGSLPRSFLRSVLHVALLPSRSHGYELLEQVRLFGLTTVDLAGVYRAMKAMEREGAVTSEWMDSELGPPRRVYELTGRGRLAAEAHLRALRSARNHLSRIENFADGALPTAPVAARNPASNPALRAR